MILLLDSNFKFACLKERNLSHVHSTFFHGKLVSKSKDLLVPEHDVRIVVQTAEPIAQDSHLFK